MMPITNTPRAIFKKGKKRGEKPLARKGGKGKIMTALCCIGACLFGGALVIGIIMAVCYFGDRYDLNIF